MKKVFVLLLILFAACSAQAQDYLFGVFGGINSLYDGDQTTDGHLGFNTGLKCEAEFSKGWILEFDTYLERKSFKEQYEDWHNTCFWSNKLGVGHKSVIDDHFAIAPVACFYYSSRWDVTLSDWLDIDVSNHNSEFANQDIGLNMGVNLYIEKNFEFSVGYNWSWVRMCPTLSGSQDNHFYATFGLVIGGSYDSPKSK